MKNYTTILIASFVFLLISVGITIATHFVNASISVKYFEAVTHRMEVIDYACDAYRLPELELDKVFIIDGVAIRCQDSVTIMPAMQGARLL